ncbi:hypothetical protein TWF730_009014 [Orbilia blumenaviensis]|uniref:C2H2-type domain-containing protein n=1 Tax=Orbilia blumenaviensis TaxID=1796055 RepID=A0AAV9UXT1_9PEZI
MQSGYYLSHPVHYTGYPSQYEGEYESWNETTYSPFQEWVHETSCPYPTQSYDMSSSRRGEAYDEICEYHCIEPGCGMKHGITLQDFTPGQLGENDIRRLIDINTGRRCPAHEPTLARSNILVQWEIPPGTLFSESVQLSRDTKRQIICPEKGCGATFKTRSEFKRHLAGIFRPFFCLRGNCCIDGVPCRKGFGRIEEVINHLRNENGQHHDAVRYRPVEGWDFRRKTPEEIQVVLDDLDMIPPEVLYESYGLSLDYGISLY